MTPPAHFYLASGRVYQFRDGFGDFGDGFEK